MHLFDQRADLHLISFFFFLFVDTVSLIMLLRSEYWTCEAVTVPKKIFIAISYQCYLLMCSPGKLHGLANYVMN